MTIIITAVLVVIATIVAIKVITKNNNNENMTDQTSNPSTSSESSSTFESTTATESTVTTSTTALEPSTDSTTEVTEPTTSEATTKNPEEIFEIVPKSEWNSTVILKDSLKLPVDQLIILETVTDQCDERLTCLKFLKQRQLLYYNQYFNGILMKSIPENYLISSDGMIYEGRGLFEGQHTYDQAGTSYNRKSIGISFLVSNLETSLNARQQGALKYLTKEFSNDEKLTERYQIYHKVQLVGGNETAISKEVETMEHWRESKFQ